MSDFSIEFQDAGRPVGPLIPAGAVPAPGARLRLCGHSFTVGTEPATAEYRPTSWGKQLVYVVPLERADPDGGSK